MSEGAISEETVLASLRDIRLPADAPGGALADLAVAVGLGGLAALLVVSLLRLVSQRKRAVHAPDLADQVAALPDLLGPERRLALLHLLRAHAPARYDALRPDLYRPDGVDLKTLEAEVARLV